MVDMALHTISTESIMALILICLSIPESAILCGTLDLLQQLICFLRAFGL